MGDNSSWKRVAAWWTALGALSGWRRRAGAAGLGFLAALALPPLHLLPLLIPAFTGLAWILAGSRNRRAAFGAGWWFGFGHFSAGFYWISFALLFEAEKFAWMIPFAVFGLGGLMALFTGAATLAATWVAGSGRRAGRHWMGILVLAASWALFEWVRGWAFTGFPWNLLGTVWVASDAMLQAASVVGTFGLSFLTVAVAAMPAALGGRANPGHGSLRAVVIAALVLAAVWAAGAVRLAGADGATVDGVRLRLVQPNIPQELKWRRDLRAGHVIRQADMSRGPGTDGAQAPPTHVIWGESMVPFPLNLDEHQKRVVANAAPAQGLVITGAQRAERTGDGFRAWNSLFALDPDGAVVGIYDKFHLVPFGEYVPFRAILKFAKVTHGRGDFTPGPGLVTLELPGLPPVSPLICYEVIFPGQVVDRANRPEWMLNLTNDAWYGRSPGPYQHFAAARLRAVEEGLPLVRVANTGISAVVDSYGRVVARLGLQKTGVIDSPLPRARPHATVFGYTGNWFTLLFLTIIIGFGKWRLNNARVEPN